MAQRYRDLVAETPVNVGARSTPSGADQAAAHLAAQLDAFSSNLRTISGGMIRKNLGEAGQEAGSIAGQHGVPTLKKGFVGATVYGEAYNNAALRSYAIRQEADADEQGARVQEEAGSDPDYFRTKMESMREGVLEEAPPEAHAVINDIYTKRIAAGVAAINVLRAREVRDEDRVLVNEQITKLSDRIARLRSQDSEAAHQLANEEEAKLFTLLDSAEADHTISSVERKAAQRATERQIIFDTVKQRFQNELESPYGDPIGFIEDLKKINRDSERLPPDQEEKLVNELFQDLRERQALRSMRHTQATLDAAAISDNIDKQATSELLSGALSTGKLVGYIDAGLDPERALTLSNGLNARHNSPPKSDPQTLATYERFLISADPNDIWNDPDLSWGDKADLVTKLHGLDTEWQGQPRAKEGYSRLERALGIQKGTPLRRLSPEEIDALDNAQTEYFNRMEALEPDQREPQALKMADEVVQVIKRAEDSNKADQVSQRIAWLKSQLEDDSLDKYTRKSYEDELNARQNELSQIESRARNAGTP